MTTNTTAAKILACALALCALAGCRQNDAGPAHQSAATQAARTSHHSYAFGAGEVKASAQVKRTVAPNGAEILEGSTELWLGGAHPLVLVEKAEIAPSGRLRSATAELLAGPRASELVRSVQLDAEAGSVTVRDHRGERAFVVPVGDPWMVGSLFADVAPSASSTTAVTAWIARRAAQAGTKIREVDASGRSQLTLAEQVVFQDGPVDLIVLGDEVAEADRDFVRTLPWKPLASAAEDLRLTGLACDLDEC